jgi:hypothetical protein
MMYCLSVHPKKEMMMRTVRMGVFGALGLITVLASCDARSVEIDTNPANITYSRDARTNLCFASLGRAAGSSILGRARSFSMTYVPCTEEVLALVPKSQGGSF